MTKMMQFLLALVFQHNTCQCPECSDSEVVRDAEVRRVPDSNDGMARFVDGIWNQSSLAFVTAAYTTSELGRKGSDPLIFISGSLRVTTTSTTARGTRVAIARAPAAALKSTRTWSASYEVVTSLNAARYVMFTGFDKLVPIIEGVAKKISIIPISRAPITAGLVTKLSKPSIRDLWGHFLMVNHWLGTRRSELILEIVLA
jgi:hypothetical protein